MNALEGGEVLVRDGGWLMVMAKRMRANRSFDSF